MMESDYKYVGAINPPIPADNFATSLFTIDKTEDYFIQNVSDGKIISFKKIDTPNLIRKVEDVMYTSVGDEYFYSYITHNNELFYGIKEIIETSLLKLLKRNDINVHSKLLISSFLQLYTQTLSYLEEVNKDLEKNGVISRIDENIAFKKEKIVDSSKFDFSILINTRFEKLNGIEPSIELEDVAFINNDKVYFENFSFDFSVFITKKTLSAKIFRKILTKLITRSYLHKRINLRNLINTNDDAYEFLLESDNIIFEQKELENFLSSETNKIEKSIIDVGLDVDKEIYEKPLSEFSKIELSNDEAKEMIVKSFSSITGTISKTINSW